MAVASLLYSAFRQAAVGDADISDKSAKQFHQAAGLFAQGRYPEAAAALAPAAEQGDREAQNLLGIMYLNALGVQQTPSQAAALFGMAAASGLKEAHYNFSNLLYNGLGIKRDEALAQEHLIQAGRAGHRPALRALGYLYHLLGNREPQWARLSTDCFRSAADAGDPLSKYTLGLRAQRGDGAEQDLSVAAYWFRAAAQDGVYLASARLAELQSMGWNSTYRDSREMADRSNHAVTLLPFRLPGPAIFTSQNEVAFVSEYPQVLDTYLCDHLINVTAPQLAPSGVVDPRTGIAMKSELRTSYSMCFQASMYDGVMAQIAVRIATIAGVSSECAEPMGVLRYSPGQEYQPHYDYYSDAQHEAQRVTTVFVYLNDVLEGGGTEFPRLGAIVKPERGKAVKFMNCDASHRPNPDTLHAGLPVIRGEKWLATLWFWDRPFIWFS